MLQNKHLMCVNQLKIMYLYFTNILMKAFLFYCGLKKKKSTYRRHLFSEKAKIISEIELKIQGLKQKITTTKKTHLVTQNYTIKSQEICCYFKHVNYLPDRFICNINDTVPVKYSAFQYLIILLYLHGVSIHYYLEHIQLAQLTA